MCFELNLPAECVADIAQSGSNDAAVAFWLSQPEVSAQFEKLADRHLAGALRGYGAWDEDELQNRQDNAKRVLWLAAWQIAEEENSDGWAYMETY